MSSRADRKGESPDAVAGGLRRPFRLAAALITATVLAAACTSRAHPSALQTTKSPVRAAASVVPSAQRVTGQPHVAKPQSPLSVSPTAEPSWPPPAQPGQTGNLAAGSDPSALPGPVLIADRDNNRLVVVDPQGRVLWQWPQPGDLAPGQTFRVPDDAFFTPDGKDIVVTQEDDFVITEIDIATRKIVWRYGQPGVQGSGPERLWNPDDAMMLADGSVIAADIKNCRLVELRVGASAPIWTAGGPGACGHAPPYRYGSPNGAFPLPNGHFLITEINGDWVDEIDLTDHVYWTAHAPGVRYPSDTSELSTGRYVTADYSNPGQVVVFDSAGHLVWRWDQLSGPGRLNHPSLAEGSPNGDIILNDDRNHRVVVIDPRTDRIVWQYGRTGTPGVTPGYLDNPDGLDLVPPNSYADRVLNNLH